MKLSIQHRDDLRRIADQDGLTLDQALGRILQRERQRRMGRQLASGLDRADQAMIAGGKAAVGQLLDRDLDASR